MRATTLKKRYPKQWANIEKCMLNDLKLRDELQIPLADRKAIAHNAAFLGVYELNAALKGKTLAPWPVMRKGKEK